MCKLWPLKKTKNMEKSKYSKWFQPKPKFELALEAFAADKFELTIKVVPKACDRL